MRAFHLELAHCRNVHPMRRVYFRIERMPGEFQFIEFHERAPVVEYVLESDLREYVA